ncbi:fructose-6-phosphate aldolase [Aliarcobacter cryaerophilus]|uniref:Fructose-6-phosphate aldolase n=1 Tax=Arcobacter sp. AZ-2023 TaxID=3074453 RepID=A0AA96IF71_9BACT|nr:fructose-6-phosphate aldolase [Arcobacter sp. AZ-2023]
MKIFLDTANIEDIKKFAQMGVIDGVTTNPALIAKEGKNFKEVVNEICSIIDGPVSAEVISTNAQQMIEEARKIAKIHKNIVVKIPATIEGYKALSVVAKEGIKTNFTIIYTSNQALIAAKLGATYVSPFVGRLDANSTSGNDLIREIVTMYKNYNFETKILAASMRNVIYVKETALAGADVATIPPEVLEQMMNNELTNVSLDGFLKQWYELDEEKRNYFN